MNEYARAMDLMADDYIGRGGTPHATDGQLNDYLHAYCGAGRMSPTISVPDFRAAVLRRWGR